MIRVTWLVVCSIVGVIYPAYAQTIGPSGSGTVGPADGPGASNTIVPRGAHDLAVRGVPSQLSPTNNQLTLAQCENLARSWPDLSEPVRAQLVATKTNCDTKMDGSK